MEKLQNRPFLQIILSALLGVLPGCSGGFVVVSLYTHNLISFGALVAMMVATAGDEAFLMLAIIPKEALILFAVLFVLSIAAGLLTKICTQRPVSLLSKNSKFIHTNTEIISI